MMMLHYGYYFYLLLIITVQVLLLQPDRALPPHLQHGRARLHPAAGLGRETQSRSDTRILALQKVAFKLHPKVLNHREGPY